MDAFSPFPVEILSEIFESTMVVDRDPYAHLSSILTSTRSVIRISHVNRRFREVSLTNPRLWTMLPPLNNIHPDFVAVFLARSRNLPIWISFTEGVTLPSDTSMWELILTGLSRCSVLCIEVDRGWNGHVAKCLLTIDAPNLRKCIITFTGTRNVCLNFDGVRFRRPFNGHAPLLESITFTGCYIPSQYCSFPRLSSLSVYHLGEGPMQQSSLSIHSRPFANSHSHLLRTLVLWNCFSVAQLEREVVSPRIILPLLEDLTVCAPSPMCTRLADLLEYPEECICRVNISFPSRISPSDAQQAAKGAASFIRDQESFRTVGIRISTAGDTALCLARSDRRMVYMAFYFEDQDATACSDETEALLRLMNVNTALPCPSITPLDIVAFSLWEALSAIIRPRICSATRLHINFPEDPENGLFPLLLRSFLFGIPRTVLAAFSPICIFSNIHFSRLLLDVLPDLYRVLISIDDEPTKKVKAGVVNFVNDRLRENRGITEVYFVVSLSFSYEMGYSRLQSLSSMLGEMDFPYSTSVSFLDSV